MVPRLSFVSRGLPSVPSRAPAPQHRAGHRKREAKLMSDDLGMKKRRSASQLTGSPIQLAKTTFRQCHESFSKAEIFSNMQGKKRAF